MRRILIIDDDSQLRKSFRKLLSEEGYGVVVAPSGEAGLEIIRSEIPDLVILDMRLPGMSGFETFEKIHEIQPKLPVIIMTAYGTTETAIEATKMGAFDYILKPFDIPDMLSVVKKAIEAGRFMRSTVEMDSLPDTASKEAIIGRSKVMQELYKAIGRVAPTDATVLIRGESGTGKELVARAIYQHSLRAEGPFLVINCVAIPETLLESELFGYEKGAFTGASHRRVGKIEQANRGTVFLDEIGDMPFGIQAKILRLLQEKSIERLGARQTIPVDVRIIAATNRDLESGVSEGRFREDLYYRLKVVTIWIPPLRERPGDIPSLIEYFLSRFSGETGMDNPGITEEAKEILCSYPWPGNVRELSNTIQKTLIFNRGAPISAEDISRAISGKRPSSSPGLQEDDLTLRKWARSRLTSTTGENLFDACIDRLAGILIAEALSLTGGNQSRAAKLLGLSRPTLHSKIEKYRLEFQTSVKQNSSKS
ncbi:MAG: sigma-54-dependent Fis family transcriptional regulator [Deltaproteobacteria bacterium]|nr:sigma-54-dependent Fis family transcriptional regulator [Deltaproteobacteria bacterium]MBW1920754.1 sigma-54-dependent Fis family transcriptional regulator [Deltaproteobacteria bacterium]MBW1934493.1 sigma-54-dependent Fis family transcriptional regulator [Deltaproteobacteria bacterium]MBW1977127.1 sigma-54-dependent Fis family transcriptional regulator [Deltaproteobacteria bacterium]MBW2044589.1 sigma-54-dependent Fis family transcriptional regulator [Deltaproteobacteria bacterium]